MKSTYGIELTTNQEKFLKARFGVKTDAELRNKLQQIAEALIRRQAVSPIDDELKGEE